MLRRRPDIMKDGAVGFFGVDQKLRTCIQELWMTFPREDANSERLEKQMKRMVERALKDFKEDIQEYQSEE